MFRNQAYFDSFYQHGTIIGEGGYKTVLRCVRADGKEEAVSIMDLQDLKSKGSFISRPSIDLIVVAQQEIQCAVLLSLLAKYKIVPFFTEIYSMFHASYTPSFISVFRASTEYLYTRMELANRGDLESFLQQQPVEDPLFILQVFLQMVLALYTAWQSVGVSLGTDE